LDPTVQTRDDLQATGLTVLGEIPKHKKGGPRGPRASE
jgi:hypothetical protein